MKKTDEDLWVESIKEPYDPNMNIYYNAHYHYGVTVEDMKAPKHVVIGKPTNDIVYYGPILHKEISDLTTDVIESLDSDKIDGKLGISFSIPKDPSMPFPSSEEEWKDIYAEYVNDLVLAFPETLKIRITDEVGSDCTDLFEESGRVMINKKAYNVYVNFDDNREVYVPNQSRDLNYDYTLTVKEE